MAAQQSEPSGAAKYLGMCGLANLLKPKRGDVVPLCTSCKREESRPFRFLPPAVQRTWIWSDTTRTFTCFKCTAQKKIESRQKEQMRDAYKKKEEEQKKEVEGRQMKRLPSGKRWERTKSFQEKYREPEHVAAAVSKAMEAPKNARDGRTLTRKGSSIVRSDADWKPDLREGDIVRHPSEGPSHHFGEGAVQGFDPQHVGSTIVEGEDEVGESLQGSNETRDAGGSRVRGQVVGATSWGDLTTSGLVDTNVSEVILEDGCSDGSSSHGPSPFDE